MTGSDAMSKRDGCGCDAAAYVLGALETEEADAFRRHMSGCAVCRDEVTALQGVADSLPMAAPQVAAPITLKRRLMADVRAEAKSRRGAAEQRPRGPLFSWPAFGRLALGRPALAAGALLAAVAIALGSYELSAGGSARIVQASVVAGSGSAVLRLADGHAELAVQHMPAPPQGHIYEVWVRRPGQPATPTNALFSVTSAGAGTVDVPGNLRGVRTVMVTTELLGGSSVPTHAPVIVAQLLPG